MDKLETIKEAIDSLFLDTSLEINEKVNILEYLVENIEGMIKSLEI